MVMKNNTQNTEALLIMKSLAASYRSKNYGDVIATYIARFHTIKRAPSESIKKAAKKIRDLSSKRLNEEFLSRHIPAAYQNRESAEHPSPRALDYVLNLPRPESMDENGEATKDFRGGVILHGGKHAGTTSAAFAMLSRWVRSDVPLRFQHNSAHELARALRNVEIEAGFERFLASSEDALFIDDLAGTRLCRKSATILFDFVTEIMRRKYVVVVTVDLAGDDLARHWSALDPSIFSICRDIVDRLRDYSVVIDFGAERKAVHQVPKIESNTTTQTSPVETV